MIYKIFVKHSSLYILGARFLCTLLMSEVHDRCMLTSVHIIFEALKNPIIQTWFQFSYSTSDDSDHSSTEPLEIFVLLSIFTNL